MQSPLARRRLPISTDVVMAALPKFRPLTADRLFRIAAHEVSHAILGTLLSTGVLQEIYIVRHVIDDAERGLMSA